MTGVCAALVSVAVTMLPPSATLGVADRLTVVTSATGSSVTVVLMVAPLATRCSKCRR